MDLAPYRDAVEFLALDGQPVKQVKSALAAVWWARRRRSKARTRSWLEQLYPERVRMHWSLSTGIFRRPKPSGTVFVHPVATAVIKWMARVRAGCLASRARLVGHGMVEGSTQYLCCGAAVEDDEHMLAGCPATGT